MALLQGKVAVITGGSSGIGLATTKRFVAEGAYVFITGRRQAELDKAVAEIGRNVTGVQGDTSKLADLDRLYAEVKAKKGKIDVLFANAGIVEIVPTAQATEEHFDKIFNVNAKGAYFTVQKAIELLNDGASIIVNGSGIWQKGFPGYSVYGGTKGAVRSFVRAWAAELKDRKIRANVISPGPVETPIIDSQFATKEQADGARDMFANITPLGRMGRPEEIAAAAVFLASSESSYITGIDLAVDGGIVSL